MRALPASAPRAPSVHLPRRVGRAGLGALLLAALGGGCGGSPDPAWALDPIWVEPVDGGIRGFQTWQIYGPRWEKNQKERTFLCTILVGIDGVETPCTDCQIAWETTVELIESDCAPDLAAAPTWTLLQRLSLGLPLEGATGQASGSAQGFADYGWGWEVHGLAWPDGSSASPAGEASWDGSTPFAFWPTLAWPLEGS